MTRQSTRLKYNAITIEEIALDVKDTLNVFAGSEGTQPFRDALENIELAITHINEASKILRSIDR